MPGDELKNDVHGVKSDPKKEENGLGKEEELPTVASNSSSSNSFVSAQMAGSSVQAMTLGPDLDLDVIQAYSMIIERYSNYYKRHHDIPNHRALDLNSLEGLLMQADVNHIELYDEMEKITAGMMTGLIYDNKQKFSTDKSRLRSHIEMCMNHPRYNREAMQRRDERRARLRIKYAQYGKEISGNKLTVFEYLEVRNASLKSACDEYQKLLAERNVTIQEKEDELSARARSIKLLGQDIVSRDAELQQKDKKLVEFSKNVEDLKKENASLRLEKYMKKEKAEKSPGDKIGNEKQPVNDSVYIDQWGISKKKSPDDLLQKEKGKESISSVKHEQSFWSRMFG